MRRASPSMRDVAQPRVSNEQWDACSKELREELFDTYPELDFYIGMTLDEDGMLSDGAPELQESTVASMELAVQLAALARVENPTEQPNAALARHCPALLTLAAQAMATPESLHVVLLLLAVRSLNRVSLLVHDSGASVDELSMITVADLLVRGGIEVTVAATGALNVRGSRGLGLGAHAELDTHQHATWDLVYLPGGLGSAETCRDDPRIQALAERQLAGGGRLAAICAAPIALVPRGLCAGRRLTSFPGVRAQVEPFCAGWIDRPVVIDGALVTSQGAGTAMHLGLELIRLLVDDATARRVANAIILPAGVWP